MSKKVLRLFSILFLSSILVLSCSNASKTGSGDNNSGNGGSSTGGSGSGTGDGGTGTGDGGTGTGGTGDGGTTTQGIAKYAGTWTATFDENTSYEVVIGNDGTVTIKDGTNNPKQATDIKKEAENKYTMTVQHSSSGIEASTVTITFDNETSGTINDTSDFHGDGVIRKQNGGNKGLWYYEGSWNFQETNGSGKGTIVIGGDDSVTFEIKQKPYTSKNVINKGSETYEVNFTIENSTLILTLKFNDDGITGSYESKTTDAPAATATGTLTKQ